MWILFTTRVFMGVASALLFIVGSQLKTEPSELSYKAQVWETIRLQEGSKGMEWFKKEKEQHINFYFFHVTNGGEILRGEAPKLLELGPYSYRKIIRREGIQEKTRDTLSFERMTTFSFDEENTWRLNCTNKMNTPCSKDDHITFINPVYLTLAYQLDKAPSALKDIFLPFLNDGDFSLGIKSEDLLITEKIDDILYNGFETKSVPIYDKMSEILQKELENEVLSKDMDNIIQLLFRPDAITNGRFSYFGKQINTKQPEGFYTIQNGRSNQENIMEIVELNGMKSLPPTFWSTVATSPSGQLSGVEGTCASIRGTDGSQFPPFLNEKVNSYYPFYFGEFGRSFDLEKTSENITADNVVTYRLHITEADFDISNPNNFCFCRHFFSCAKLSDDSWDISNCTDCKNGIFDISPSMGSPVFASNPHFLNADSEVQNYASGLCPDPSMHDTFFDVEPHFGVPLLSHKRVQYSLPFRKTLGPYFLEKIKDFILIPIFWSDEVQSWDSHRGLELKDVILAQTTRNANDTLETALTYTVGSFCLCIFIVLSFTERYFNGRNNQNEKDRNDIQIVPNETWINLN